MADITAAAPTPPRPPRKRRRPAVVCAECRRRKIACDRKSPCGQCALHNVECVYVTGAVPPPYGRPVRKTNSSATSPVSQRSGGLPPLPTPTATAATITTGSGTGADTDGCDAKTRNIDSRGTSPLEDDAPIGDETRPGHGLSALGERSQRFGGRLAKTRLFGRTHWMNNMDEFKDIHSMTHLVHFVSDSPIYKSMRMCKRIGRVIKAAEANKIRASAQPSDPDWFQVPPRAVADRLLDLYFNVFEPAFRVLHMPTFRKEYRQFMDAVEANGGKAPHVEGDGERISGRESPTDVFQIKLVLVLALGSCFYDPPDDSPTPSTNTNPSNPSSPETAQSTTPDTTFHDYLRVAAARAVRKMDVAYCVTLDKHRLNLDTVQIYCLVVLARQTTALEFGDDLSWFSTGALLHTAFGMGLNRDPAHFKSLSFAQAELRRRLWATILELVVQSSLDQGMPPLISADDYDTAPPSNLNDEEWATEDDPPATLDIRPDRQNDSSTGAAPPTTFRPPAAGHPDALFTHASVQRLLYRSLPIRLQITKALNGLGTGLTYERALQMSSDLLEACRYTTAFLKTAPLMADAPTADAPRRTPDQEREHAAFARLRVAVYELLTRRFHHSLHSPFARKAGADVQYFYSRRARIETVLRLLAFFRPTTSTNDSLSSPDNPDDADGGGAAFRRYRHRRPVSAAADPCRRLWLIGRGLFKCTIVDFKGTVTIELIHQLRDEDYVPGNDLTSSQRELYDAIVTITELAHARIRETGETNVKGYLFFRGAQAQIDALMVGRPVRQMIANAAATAAQQALETLRELAARKGVALPADLKGDGDAREPGNAGADADADVKSELLTISPVTLQTGRDPLPVQTGGAFVKPLRHHHQMPMVADVAGVGPFDGDVDMANSTFTSSPADIVVAAAAAALHLPTPDISAAGSTSNFSDGLGPPGIAGYSTWVDDWMDPQGDFGFGNWFFPYNDRINNS